jgi:prepilin-type N-terminal cleavage/methylation domain-containing protein
LPVSLSCKKYQGGLCNNAGTRLAYYFQGRYVLRELSLAKRNGFTLLEVIAVLLILGVLAVIAIPKYIGLIDHARKLAARVAIAEVKIRLSQAQARYMMRNGGIGPTGPQLYVYATTAGNGTYDTPANLIDVGRDFNVDVAGSNIPIKITVDKVQNQTIPIVVGYFNAAGD